MFSEERSCVSSCARTLPDLSPWSSTPRVVIDDGRAACPRLPDCQSPCMPDGALCCPTPGLQVSALGWAAVRECRRPLPLPARCSTFPQALHHPSLAGLVPELRFVPLLKIHAAFKKSVHDDLSSVAARRHLVLRSDFPQTLRPSLPSSLFLVSLHSFFFATLTSLSDFPLRTTLHHEQPLASNDIHV